VVVGLLGLRRYAAHECEGLCEVGEHELTVEVTVDVRPTGRRFEQIVHTVKLRRRLNWCEGGGCEAGAAPVGPDAGAPS